MRRCSRCHEPNIFDNRRICTGCMKLWSDMRARAWASLEPKLGKLTPETHPSWIKEMKRLEKIWRKSPVDFENELLKLEI